MTATAPPAPAASPEAASYLAAVEAGLAGVAPAERAELLDDLSGHLAELSAEGPVSLHDVLGPPAEYAAELLASLGIVAGAGEPVSRGARLRSVFEGSAPVQAARRVWDSWGGREATSVAAALRPAWWILRAYVAVYLLAGLLPHRNFPDFPFPALLHSAVLGFLAVLAAIPISVRLGRRARRRGALKNLMVLGNIALLIYGGVLLHFIADRRPVDVRSYSPYQSATAQPEQGQNCLTNGAGQLITNLYPYTMDGKLTQILLFDQTGQPINNLCPFSDSQGRQLNTQYAKDANGAAVYNVFPREQTVAIPEPASQAPFGEAPGPLTSPSPVPPPAIVIPQLAGAPQPATPTVTETATATATPSPTPS